MIGKSSKDTLSFLPSLILTGNVANGEDLRDIFIHLNDEKIFYSANFKLPKAASSNLAGSREVLFRTPLELAPGKNQISVFIRDRFGLTSERRMRVLLRK